MKDRIQNNLKDEIHLVEVGLKSDEILNITKDEISQFQSSLKKVNFFSKDEDDEFFVFRENNTKQGIFKTWAIPIIPFLESDSLSIFNELLETTSNLKVDIESNKILKENFEDWTKINSKHPARYFESLERWRFYSQLYDKRLAKHFQETPLPEKQDEKIAELFLRLITSFEVSSPFYNLEAIVGDTNNSKYNPSNKDALEQKGGSLDVVGMLLPSALPSQVLAKKLDWNGLNWEQIKQNLCKASLEEQKTIFRISKELDVPAEDVIFAANALEWIPVNVGGKKGDVDAVSAQKLILNSLDTNKVSTTDGVSRNMNALIRFLNWFPLLKNSKNFDGEDWRYSSVCDTSSQLVNEIKDGNYLNKDFRDSFSKIISPQIKEVDATSAKGRLMLQLLLEGKFEPTIYKLITERSKLFKNEILKIIAKNKSQEYVVDINDHLPRAFVGGKSAGLREAGIVFGKENVIPGVTITSEAINDWLKHNNYIWNKIIELNNTNDLDIKLQLAKSIELDINTSEFPIKVNGGFFNTNSPFVIARSSSFDEDSDITGSAAGIYESVPCFSKDQLSSSIGRVVSSFFSEKAVSFRSLHGLSDLPLFAVILNPLIEGHGGIAFSLGSGKGWEVVTGETPSHVANNYSTGFDSFKYSEGILTKVNTNSWVNEDIILEIGEMTKKAEEFLGMNVDIEFVVDKNNKIWILQMRTLHNKETIVSSDTNEDLKEIGIVNLDDLNKLKIEDGVKLKLDIGTDVDLNQFQGTLFRWLVVNRDSIKEISLSKRIPRTGHFANICLQLGIKLNLPDAK